MAASAPTAVAAVDGILRDLAAVADPVNRATLLAYCGGLLQDAAGQAGHPPAAVALHEAATACAATAATEQRILQIGGVTNGRAAQLWARLAGTPSRRARAQLLEALAGLAVTGLARDTLMAIAATERTAQAADPLRGVTR
jgi:hypothetical protein